MLFRSSGVDEREDDSIRADAERQRQRRDDSEARLLQKHPEAVKDVLPESRHGLRRFRSSVSGLDDANGEKFRNFCGILRQALPIRLLTSPA